MDYVTRIARLIRAELDSRVLPDEPVDDLLRVYAVLVLALGDDVTPADVHDAWVAWMVGRDRAHPALVPFEELGGEAAREDLPFVMAIHSVARANGLGRRATGISPGG